MHTLAIHTPGTAVGEEDNHKADDRQEDSQVSNDLKGDIHSFVLVGFWGDVLKEKEQTSHV